MGTVDTTPDPLVDPDGDAPAGEPAPPAGLQPTDLDAYRRPTRFVDSGHPVVVAFAERHTAGAADEARRASLLFRAVRDGIRYDPYSVSGDPEAYRASTVATVEAAYCVPKAVLLAASARAVGIPARVGFADVRNHLQSEKLRERMGTDLFVCHGFTELHLGGRWVKATPTFNIELCERFGVAPLEFDGTEDALLHQNAAGGGRYMEYVSDRGAFVDLPLDWLLAMLRHHYGAGLVAAPGPGPDHAGTAAGGDACDRGHGPADEMFAPVAGPPPTPVTGV